MRDEPADPRPGDQRERQSERSYCNADRCFYEYVPVTGQEKGRQEMPVEPALIGGEGAGEEADTDSCDHDLGNHADREASGLAI